MLSDVQYSGCTQTEVNETEGKDVYTSMHGHSTNELSEVLKKWSWVNTWVHRVPKYKHKVMHTEYLYLPHLFWLKLH